MQVILVTRLHSDIGNFDAYGPILLGLNAPVNDLSRGCNAAEVYSMAIITADTCINHIVSNTKGVLLMQERLFWEFHYAVIKQLRKEVLL